MKNSMLWNSAKPLLALFAAFLFAVCIPGGAAYAQSDEPPADFAMEETGDVAPVIFSHTNHAEKQKLECNSCHTKIFKVKKGKTAQKKGPLTMAAMENGEFCGTCHDGKTSFDVKSKEDCARCHVKK